MCGFIRAVSALWVARAGVSRAVGRVAVHYASSGLVSARSVGSYMC